MGFRVYGMGAMLNGMTQVGVPGSVALTICDVYTACTRGRSLSGCAVWSRAIKGHLVRR